MNSQALRSLLGCWLVVVALPGLSTVCTVVSYRSPATGLTLRATVLLPDSYQTQPTKRYPVFYLLHGHTGNFTSWLNYARFPPRYADDYQTIVVLADGGNSFYVNWDGQTDGKTHPQFAVAIYWAIEPTANQTSSRLTLGFRLISASTNGWRLSRGR